MNKNKPKRNYFPWTEAEVEILVKNYSRMKLNALKELLPNRSTMAIYKKATALNLKRNNNAQYLEKYLKKYWGKQTYSSMELNTGISRNTIKYQAHRLGYFY